MLLNIINTKLLVQATPC